MYTSIVILMLHKSMSENNLDESRLQPRQRITSIDISISGLLRLQIVFHDKLRTGDVEYLVSCVIVRYCTIWLNSAVVFSSNFILIVLFCCLLSSMQ